MLEGIIHQAKADTTIKGSLPTEFRPAPTGIDKVKEALPELVEAVHDAAQRANPHSRGEEKILEVVKDSALLIKDGLARGLDISDFGGLTKMSMGAALIVRSADIPGSATRSAPEELRAIFNLSASQPEVFGAIKKITPVLETLAKGAMQQKPGSLSIDLTVMGMREDVEELERRITEAVTSEIKNQQQESADRHGWEEVNDKDGKPIRFAPPLGSGMSVIEPPSVEQE